MKSVAASAGNSLTFGSQDLVDTMYVDAICFTSFLTVCLYSEEEDKQDVTEDENKQEATVTRQGYTYNVFEVPAVTSFFFLDVSK
jgi:hypothetical protein